MNKQVLVMAIALLSAIMLSCSDDYVAQQTEVIEETEAPPIDSLKVKIVQPAYVFSYNYSRTGAALINRMVFQATTFDSSVSTVVLNDGNVPMLSRNDYKDIASLVARGGSLVYCDATRDGVDAFLRNLKTVGLEMFDKDELHPNEVGYHACRYILNIKEDAKGKYLPPFVDNDDTDGIICDIIAFRGNKQSVVADLGERRTVTTSVTEDADPTDADNCREEVSSQPSDYIYGLHADKVAEWLNNTSDNDQQGLQEAKLMFMAGINENETDIDKISKAQEVQYSFTASLGYKHAPVTVTYYVWAVHDDQGADYYLIHQELSVENSKLKCGPVKETSWNHNVKQYFEDVPSKNPYVFWAYMTRVIAQLNFSDDDVELSSVSPSNNISEQTTYKEGIQWSLNTSFVATTNPHLEFGGGVKMDKEWTHNIPDLALTYQRNKNKPKWVYAATTLPRKIMRGGYDAHESPKDIMKTDCEFGHSWIWKIKDANTTYSFNTDIQVDLQALWLDGHKGKHGYKTVFNNNTTTITLLPPPRYQQEWLMRMSPVNKAAFESLEKTFANYWVENFSLYTVEQNDRKAIDNWIKDLKVIIENNPQSIKDAGLGTFTLTWKLLKEPNDYTSYTYTPTE